MREPPTKPIYDGDAYGCCVRHGGCWFYVNRDWGITCTPDPPTGRIDLVGNKWFAPQVLLEYAQLITDIDNSCNNPDAMWPITLVQTAEKVDLLTKTLANFLGKGHEVNEPSHKKQWIVGELPGNNEHICGWKHERIYIYEHAGRELALCIRLVSSFRATDEGNSQETFSAIRASYGQDIKTSLHRIRQCSWADFHQDFYNALKEYEPNKFYGFKETSADLFKQHEQDLARHFMNAVDYEFKKDQKNQQNRSKLLEERQAWCLKESRYKSQVSKLEVEKSKHDDIISKEVEYTNQQNSKLADAEKEVRNLRNELSEYRATLGSLSSGLNSMNIGKDAGLPPLHEILETYDKVVPTVERLYDNIVENVDCSLKLMFAVNLSAILHKMWEAAYHRYIGLVKDLCGCDDLAKLTTTSINKCDKHCRQHWEYLFMPLLDDLISMPAEKHDPVERDIPTRSIIRRSSPPVQSADASALAKVQENSLEACPRVCNDHSGFDIKHQQLPGSSQENSETQSKQLPTSGDVNKAHGEDSGAQHEQYPMDCEEGPVVVHTPNHTNEDFSGPMEWFLNKNNKAEGAFKRLWKVVVCLFLQRPVCAFQFMENVTVEVQSEIYQTIDGHTPQNGEQVIVLLPPIRVCPKSILATEIGEEGCDASNWTTMRKGIVDFKDTQ